MSIRQRTEYLAELFAGLHEAKGGIKRAQAAALAQHKLLGHASELSVQQQCEYLLGDIIRLCDRIKRAETHLQNADGMGAHSSRIAQFERFVAQANAS